MHECVFCGIAEKNDPPHEILWRDSAHVAFLDAHPAREGHTLVIPMKHASNVLDMDDDAYKAFFAAGKFVAEKLRRYFAVERIGFMVEGLAVGHAHLHLIPIHSGNDVPMFAPSSTPSGGLAELGEKLRTVFN